MFAWVIGLFTAGLCVGSFFLAADAFDGTVAIRIRRGGRIALSGWKAYLYGIGAALIMLGTGVGTIGLLKVVLAPQRWGRRAMKMFPVAYTLFVAGAVVVTIAVVARLLF